MRCLVLLVAGCSFSSKTPGTEGPHDASEVMVDVLSEAPPCGWLYAPSNFDPCQLPPPAPPLTVPAGSTTTIDSNAVGPNAIVLDQSDGTQLLVVHLSSLDVFGRLDVTGPRGVVLAVEQAATIAGAGFVPVTAAANNDVQCNGMTGEPGTPSTMSGGGGGGGGGGAGSGDGGDGGDGAGTNKGLKGAKGIKKDSTLVPLRAGCRGGVGGGEPGGGVPGTGGSGGGALQISSNAAVSIFGFVFAGGDGAGATDARTGGGGGGSGGGLLLEGRTITVAGTGVLCADGGSGGQGGSTAVDASAGRRSPCNGISGATTINNPGATEGGFGGRGGFRSNDNAGHATSASVGAGGGGGGGGGAGWIRLRSIDSAPSLSGVVTPAAN